MLNFTLIQHITSILPSDILEVMHTCVTQIPYANPIEVISPSDELQQTQLLSPFRPRSLALLLHAIQLVVHPDEGRQLSSPRESLDPAQTMLLRWGATIPWCWTIWSDQRIMNAECVTYLVSPTKDREESARFE